MAEQTELEWLKAQTEANVDLALLLKRRSVRIVNHMEALHEKHPAVRRFVAWDQTASAHRDEFDECLKRIGRLTLAAMEELDKDAEAKR